MRISYIRILFILFLYCSCHQNDKRTNDIIVDSVVGSSIDTLKKINYGIDINDVIAKTSEKYKDSTFNYRLKAYDTIEFGSHKNYNGIYYQILYLTFKVFAQQDSYYGLYNLSLISDGRAYSVDDAKDDLKDISDVIEKKYSNSFLVNKYIHNKDALLQMECKIAVSPQEFDNASVPVDAGEQYVYKAWTTSEIVVELGYRVHYDWKLKDEQNKKSIEFTRKYQIYIDFKSSYLNKQIDDRSRKEKQKLILDNSSKF